MSERLIVGIRKNSAPRGFALIVTLSLMILLTVVAVGLLTLSSISLRSAAGQDAVSSARANARMALMLALGDVQKHLGPDTRISAPADQLAGTDASVSTTPRSQRHWTGAYNSWRAAPPNSPRPEPEFLQWFVSGSQTELQQKSYAATEISGSSIEIVTSNAVGKDGDTVRVPLMTMADGKRHKNRYAWWVSDLGTKAQIAQANKLPTSVAEVRADQQTAPAIHLAAALSGSEKPFQSLISTDPRLSRVSTWQSSALLADKPENIRGLFHDFTASNRGLLTNVRAGGFRKDLSMALERSVNAAPNPVTSALYTVRGEPGINLQELWSYYTLATPGNTLGLQRSGGASFTTGGSMSSGTPHLRLGGTPSACQNDSYFYYKQPVVINYQLVLSFQTRMVDGSNVLHLVSDPIITLWNPLDVPVVVPPGLTFSVKYWQIPYDFSITKNGARQDCPMAGISLGDSNYLSLEVGGLEQLAFKPGEVIKMSQFGNTISRSGVPDIHALAGKKGFLFGSGVAMPIYTTSRTTLSAAGTDKLVFSSATPNNLTAGQTSSDGQVLPGGASHTRHFSLTHHEFYVGKDRESNSLGIGGAYLDWDFGNKRPAPNSVLRLFNSPGTKSSGDRYKAVGRRDIFKTFSDGRTIPTSGAKMPFMLLTFNAKVENGSTQGTRSLARFNPKALHVDFYNLSESERDMMPYEYQVELLNGWKSASNTLEESVNGNGYFGGGYGVADGSSFVTTHSVPREPIISLAAFQHSFANGFNMQKPIYGYGTLNAREPMQPQISHAIGNSMAPSVLGKDKVEGTLPGSRPMADHSYLANQALWDDWFLSGITPQTTGFSQSRLQRAVALDFFKGDAGLPVTSYKVDIRGQDPDRLISNYFAGTTPRDAATQAIASLIRVDGMFNVNSTSVEAWKSLLAGRKNRPLVIRDNNGRESVISNESETPIAGLMGPLDVVAKGNGNIDSQEAGQWVGRRTLDDSEIDSLARSIVKEVRKRGPFISLGDFVNRRPGNDVELARAGAIQSALDDNDVEINSAFRSGNRAVGGASARFPFPQAEEGPVAFGSPGIVKQADILTPIAPILSARSDSFLIRGYGEKTDSAGNVIARAWCEAVVQRAPQFIDPADSVDKVPTAINSVNQKFGRRFEIVSFRWLNASEA